MKICYILTGQPYDYKPNWLIMHLFAILYRFETNKVSVSGEYNMWKTASHMRKTVVKSNCATHHEKFCV